MDFKGTDRYVINRRLGAGGMGVVYRAFDTLRKIPVALKTLKNVDAADAAAIYRLKREFRSLVDVAHPSLVVLHDLVSADGQWFFTMELLEGVDFVRHVRPTTGANPVPADEQTLPPGLAPSPHVSPVAPAAGALDLNRLRSSLLRLAEGVRALHGAGKLHRDIKPSNVMVEPDGRVVLLDFGLATELDPSPSDQSTDQHLVGTAAYMAPEQAAMQPVGAAADWYSVGAMLHQALTGRPPFEGSCSQILFDKQSHEPRPPAELAPFVPPDLNALCVELLRREPQRRPSGAEVLRRLALHGAVVEAAPEPRPAVPLFVGRESPLGQLREAFACVAAGRTAVALVQGRSGMGKTSLARHFLDELGPAAVVLAGRCFEREAVPYKALDSLIDALTRYLGRLPRLNAEALLPRDVAALARMFPVLRRVAAVAEAPRRAAESSDPHELRRRAFVALRELLGRLADRAPLVLFIDDLQWGDADSAALLAEMLRPPDAPALLLLVCYRSEDLATTRLTELLIPVLASGSSADVREVTLEPLTPEEGARLASALLENAAGGRAEAIVREAGGNPLFLDTLARHAGAGASLEEVLLSRTARLSDGARRLLEVVAVAGQPISLELAAAAANLEAGGLAESAQLRAALLVRSTVSGEREALETYHDRVRETVAAHLAPEALRERHLSIATALEASGRDEPQALAVHYAAADERGRAAPFAEAAASRAAEALAFDRAATFCHLALELYPADMPGRRALEVRLADALASGGRGREAASAYLAAARRTQAQPPSAEEALELERKAAEQLLRSGHIDEGLATLRSVMRSAGMTLAKTPRRAAGALLFRRVRAKMRGTRFSERDASEVPAEELARVDLCWSVAVGLGMVDTIRGASFQTRHLLLALEAGEPLRVCRALAAEAAFVATAGVKARARAESLVEQARELSLRTGDSHAMGLVTLCGGMAAFFGGRWRAARDQCEQAVRVFRDEGSPVTWEAANAELFTLWSLFYLGEIAELRRRVSVLMVEAEERGNQYVVTSLRCGLANVPRLAANDPDGARREVAEEVARWSHQGYHVQHCWALMAQGMTELYAGEGAAALTLVRHEWPRLKRSLLLRVQNLRVEAVHLRARAALAAALSTSGARREALLAAALRDAARLEKEPAAWSKGLGVLVRAGAAAAAGELGQAAAQYTLAEERLRKENMAHFAAAALRGKALLGGPAAAEQLATADAWFSRQGVSRPECLARMLAPGAG